MSEHDDSGPVTVFRTNDPGLPAVAQSLLEGADIEFFVAGQAVSGLYPGGATGPYGVPEIRVAAQNADEARDLLKDLGH
jgi:Putative prokaryotic signal transducing protein